MYEVTVTAIDKGALETYRLTFESREVFDMLLRTDAARSWRVGIEKLEGVRELEEINLAADKSMQKEEREDRELQEATERYLQNHPEKKGGE
jgi:hypothetical protein